MHLPNITLCYAIIIIKNISHHISQLHVLARFCGAVFRLSFLKNILYTIDNVLLGTRFLIIFDKQRVVLDYIFHTEWRKKSRPAVS